MVGEQMTADMELFDLEELADSENRVKMCYAFLKSQQFFHQELSILNPKPTQISPEYVFPTDLYLYAYHNDSDEELLPLAKLQEIAAEAETPIICIGSHREEEDRTIQLIALPQLMATPDLLQRELILVRFLVPVSEEEKKSVMNGLKQAYAQV